MSTTRQYIERNGIPYVLETTCVRDRCTACKGDGFTTYSTFGDYRAYINELEYSDEDVELRETGRKECERCNGTGTFIGDPQVIDFKMSLNSSLVQLP